MTDTLQENKHPLTGRTLYGVPPEIVGQTKHGLDLGTPWQRGLPPLTVPILGKSEGVMTERSITLEGPDGSWWNMPSIYDGVLYDPLKNEEEIWRFANERNEAIGPFSTVEEAEQAAAQRSKMLEETMDLGSPNYMDRKVWEDSRKWRVEEEARLKDRRFELEERLKGPLDIQRAEPLVIQGEIDEIKEALNNLEQSSYEKYEADRDRYKYKKFKMDIQSRRARNGLQPLDEELLEASYLKKKRLGEIHQLNRIREEVGEEPLPSEMFDPAGFFKSFGEEVSIPFVNVIYDADKMVELYNAAQRVHMNEGTEDDEIMLKKFWADMEFERLRGRTTGGRIGAIVGESATFMAEFLITMGIARGGVGLATMAAKKEGRDQIMASVRKLIRGRVRRDVERTAAMGAAKKGAKKTAMRQVGDVLVESTLQTAMVGGLGGFELGAYREAFPQMDIKEDEVGELQLILDEPGDVDDVAWFRSAAGLWVEFVSERTGGALNAGLKKVGAEELKKNVVKRLKASFVAKWFSRPGNKGKTMADFSQALLKHGGWHGVIAEDFEEWVGSGMHTIKDLATLRKDKKDWDDWTEVWGRHVPGVQGWLERLAAFAVPGTVTRAPHLIGTIGGAGREEAREGALELASRTEEIEDLQRHAAMGGEVMGVVEEEVQDVDTTKPHRQIVVSDAGGRVVATIPAASAENEQEIMDALEQEQRDEEGWADLTFTSEEAPAAVEEAAPAPEAVAPEVVAPEAEAPEGAVEAPEEAPAVAAAARRPGAEGVPVPPPARPKRNLEALPEESRDQVNANLDAMEAELGEGVTVDVVPAERQSDFIGNMNEKLEGTGVTVVPIESRDAEGNPSEAVGGFVPDNPNVIYVEDVGQITDPKQRRRAIRRNTIGILAHEMTHSLEQTNPEVFDYLVSQAPGLIYRGGQFYEQTELGERVMEEGDARMRVSEAAAALVEEQAMKWGAGRWVGTAAERTLMEKFVDWVRDVSTRMGLRGRTAMEVRAVVSEMLQGKKPSEIKLTEKQRKRLEKARQRGLAPREPGAEEEGVRFAARKDGPRRLGPRQLQTLDGYRFWLMEDGTVVDSPDPSLLDMSWTNIDEFMLDTGAVFLDVEPQDLTQHEYILHRINEIEGKNAATFTLNTLRDLHLEHIIDPTLEAIIKEHQSAVKLAQERGEEIHPRVLEDYGKSAGRDPSRGFRFAARKGQPGHKGVTDRVPELQEGARKIRTGEIGQPEYQELIDMHKPVRPYTSVPEPATREEIVGALTKNKKSKVGAADHLERGHAVGLRLDIPAYRDHGIWVPTIHEGKGKPSPIGYAGVAAITDATFSMSEEAALKIAEGGAKSPFAVIKGAWDPTTPEEAKALAERALEDPSWTQVGMDPIRHSFFFDRTTQEPILRADRAVQVGPLVMVENPVRGTASTFRFTARKGKPKPSGKAKETAEEKAERAKKKADKKRYKERFKIREAGRRKGEAEGLKKGIEKGEEIGIRKGVAWAKKQLRKDKKEWQRVKADLIKTIKRVVAPANQGKYLSVVAKVESEEQLFDAWHRIELDALNFGWTREKKRFKDQAKRFRRAKSKKRIPTNEQQKELQELINKAEVLRKQQKTEKGGEAKFKDIDAADRAINQLEEITNEIEQKINEAREESRSVVLGQKQTRKEATEKITEEVKEAKKKIKVKGDRAEVEMPWPKALLQTAKRINFNIQSLVLRLAGKDSLMYKLFVTAFREAENKVTAGVRDITKKLEDAAKAAGFKSLQHAGIIMEGTHGRGSQVTLVVMLGGKKRRLTLGEASTFALLDNDTLTKIFAGTHVQKKGAVAGVHKFGEVTIEEIEGVRNELRQMHEAGKIPDVLAFGQSMKDLMEKEIRPVLFQAIRELTGVEPDMVEGYWPMSRLFTSKKEETPDSYVNDVNSIGHEVQTYLENSGMLQSRDPGAKGSKTPPIQIGGSLTTFTDHMNLAMRVTHLSEALRLADHVLRDRDFVNAMEERWGKHAIPALKEYLMSATGMRDYYKGAWDKGWGWLQSNIGGALINLNPQTWMVQFSGIPRFANYFGIVDFMAGVKYALTHAKKGRESLEGAEGNGYFWSRWHRSAYDRFSPTKSGSLSPADPGRFRTNVATLGSQLLRMKLGSALKTTRHLQDSIGVLDAIDSIISSVAYGAARNKIERESPGLSEKEIESRATDMASDAVRSSQNSTSTLDQTVGALYGRQNWFLRQLLMYKTDPMQEYNMLLTAKKEGKKAMARAAASVIASKTAALYIRAAYGVGLSAAGAAAIAALGGNDDDRKKAEKVERLDETFMRNLRRELITLVGGAYAETVLEEVEGFISKPGEGPLPDTAVTDIVGQGARLTQRLYGVVEDMNEEDAYGLWSATLIASGKTLNTLGAILTGWTGYPVTRQALYILEDSASDPVQDVRQLNTFYEDIFETYDEAVEKGEEPPFTQDHINAMYDMHLRVKGAMDQLKVLDKDIKYLKDQRDQIKDDPNMTEEKRDETVQSINDDIIGIKKDKEEIALEALGNISPTTPGTEVEEK